MIKNQGERWWNKVEQRHDRSGIGNLIRPEDIYTSPWDLDDRLRLFNGLRPRPARRRRRPRLRQLRALGNRVPHPPHRTLPRLHTRDDRRSSVAHQAGSPRPPHRTQPGRSRTPRLAPAGVSSPLPPRLPQHGRRLRNHLLRELLPRRQHQHARHRPHPHRQRRPGAGPRKSQRPPDRRLRRQRPLRRSRHPGAPRHPQIQNRRLHLRLPRPRRRRLRRPRRTRHRPLRRPARPRRELRQSARAHDPRVRRRRQALRPAHPPRPHPEIPQHRDRPRPGPQQTRLASLAEDQSPR